MQQPFLIHTLIVCGLCLSACGGPGGASDVEMPTGIPLPVVEDRPHHEQEVRHLALSPGGHVLATISGDSMQLWDTSKMKPFAVVPGEYELEFVEKAVVSRNGRYAVVLNKAGQFFLWDSDSLKKRQIKNRWGDEPSTLIGFDDQDRLYWISTDRRLLAWDLGDGIANADSPKEVDYLGYVDYVGGRGQRWSLIGLKSTILQAGESAALEPMELQWPEDPPDAPPVPLPDGSGVAGIFGGEIYVLKSGSAPRRLASDHVRGFAGRADLIAATSLDPSGRWFAIGWDSGGVEIWDLQEERMAGRLNVGPPDVREVQPQKILDLVLGDTDLFVLLPEQKLVSFRVDDWVRSGTVDL